MVTRGKNVAALAAVCAVLVAMAGSATAQDPPAAPAPQAAPAPVVDPVDAFDKAKEPGNVSTTIEILFFLTIVSLAPAMLVMVTSFTRIVIVLSFVRKAVGTQETPPNQVLTGLALLLTFMVMAPTFHAIKRDALDPYTSKDPKTQIAGDVALDRAVTHLRTFMFGQVRVKDVELFMDITGQPEREGGWYEEDVPTEVLIPSFVLSELRRAFVMGFALFLPFVIIDMVVSAVLITMGMLVLPPMFISLPFKVLLFVLVDGWHLIVGSLVESFHVG